MGDQRTRLIFGNAMQAGASSFGDKFERDREEKIRQEGFVRDDFVREENARINREAAEATSLRNRQDYGVEQAGSSLTDPRERIKAQIAASPEIAGQMGLQGNLDAMDESVTGAEENIANLKRVRKDEGREAFQALGGRQSLQGSKQVLQDVTGVEPSTKGQDKLEEALSALSSAQTSSALRDAATRVRASKIAKRPAVRRQLAAVEERIKQMEAAESKDTQDALNLKGTSSSGSGMGVFGQEDLPAAYNPDLEYPEGFNHLGYAQELSGGKQGNRGSMMRGVNDQVAKVVKDYKVQSAAFENLYRAATEEGIESGPGAIMGIYQFLRSQDNSVVREGEIRLLQEGLTMGGRVGKSVENFMRSVGITTEDLNNGTISKEARDALRSGELAKILTTEQAGSIMRLATIMAETADKHYRMSIPINTRGRYMVHMGQDVPDLFAALRRVQADEAAGGGGEGDGGKPLEEMTTAEKLKELTGGAG